VTGSFALAGIGRPPHRAGSGDGAIDAGRGWDRSRI